MTLPAFHASFRGRSTKGNQVLHCIAAELASRLQMMNLQIVMEPHSWHRQPSRSSTWLCSDRYSFGLNLILGRFCRRLIEIIQNLQIYGWFSERSAPARKSAQIISRQYPLDLSVPSIRPAVSRAFSTTGN